MSEGGGTRMNRKEAMDVSLPFWIMIKTVAWWLIGKPGMKKSSEQLKAKLEK